jgi:hypothetical protein
MHGMMDLQVLKQWHEERLREAESNRLAKALRATRKRYAEWSSALAWELKRGAERVLKILQAPKNAG